CQDVYILSSRGTGNDKEFLGGSQSRLPCNTTRYRSASGGSSVLDVAGKADPFNTPIAHDHVDHIAAMRGLGGVVITETILWLGLVQGWVKARTRLRAGDGILDGPKRCIWVEAYHGTVIATVGRERRKETPK